MTTIGLIANDQLLVINSKPKLSSGDQNTVKVHVDFSDDWDGFGKSAVFFTARNRNTVYEKVLISGECTIPAEVIAESGILFIGVRGVNSNNNEVKTTSLVKYKISEGAPQGTGTEIEPTPSVYQQLLTAYETEVSHRIADTTDLKSRLNVERSDRQSEITVERSRIDTLMRLQDGSTTGDAELQDIRVGYDGVTSGTAGNSVRRQINYLKNNKVSTVNSVSPDGNGNVDVDMSFLSNIQPLVINSDTKIPIDIRTEACLIDGSIGRKIIVECKNNTGIRVYGKDFSITGTNEILFKNQSGAFTLFFDTTNKTFIASPKETDKNYTYPRYCKFATIRSNWITNVNYEAPIWGISCNFNCTINGGHLWNESQIKEIIKQETTEQGKTYNYFTDKTFATEKLGYNISKMYSLPTKPEGTTSAQGMAISNGVIFQFYNDNKVTLIDYATGKKITTLDITSGHGDTAEFSNEKYAEDDEFNLIYTTTDTYPSQVRIHRITRTGTELIRTLTFPTDKTKNFAGHCTDFDNGIMYQVGYATNSYYNAENNYMVVSKWNLNALTENSDGTFTPSYLGSFNIPFITTVQDQMFYDGKLFLISSHWENPQTIIYVVDPTKECIVNKIEELPTDIKDYELEGIDKIFNGNKLNIILSLHNKGVYKMSFN